MNLRAAVQGLPLKGGQINGLTKPLDNALRSLARGKTADACNQLQDFILKVTAKIPTPLATAGTLITDADAIRSSLGCE